MASSYYYKSEVTHSGLNKYRIVKAATRYELDQRVNAIKAQWDEQWSRELQKRAKESERVTKLKSCEDSLADANEMTHQAESVQRALDTILMNSLRPQSLDSNKLKDFSRYPVHKPQSPKLRVVPTMPQTTDAKYNPKLPFFTRISKRKKQKFVSNNNRLYERDIDAWEANKESIELTNNVIIKHQKSLIDQWEADNAEFLQNQTENNERIDTIFRNYKFGDVTSVEQYFTWVLEGMNYPFNYDRTVEIEYDEKSKRMLVELLFPKLEDIPVLKEVSYVKSRNELKEINYSESYMKRKYDNIIYQIVLQTLNLVFILGAENKLVDSVVINGKIETIDKATGKNIEPYILSICTMRNEFESINLYAVDPKTWFRSSKGVSAVSFANVTPVAPIIAMDRDDDRFIEGYGVADQLNDSVNLAAIDWQDFEHLIREIFEKEFNTNGGEVKITRASRDGGVDAIAFDPDPIRGGKIVIQAKRYTNVVGVSAVRDLYGTLMNEGATKGILVTTSNYGSDAYSFAQGKPIKLMNGAELLYLLERHGHKARIDIKEAKNILNSTV
ncbi:MAG: restriction endonuclease [Eubacteriales bacterium]|nr:restriction endonuclease [Eubacteriales bacterium]